MVDWRMLAAASVGATLTWGCSGDDKPTRGKASSAPSVAVPTTTNAPAKVSLTSEQRKELYAVFDADVAGREKCAGVEAAHARAVESEVKDWTAVRDLGIAYNNCREAWLKTLSAKTSKFNLAEKDLIHEMQTWDLERIRTKKAK